MPACRIDTELEGDHTIIRVAGVLDRASAFALRERLATERAEDVVLDLSLVLELDDLGVATLAHELAGERRLHFRGLRQHQLRMLRYFGVDAEADRLAS